MGGYGTSVTMRWLEVFDNCGGVPASQPLSICFCSSMAKVPRPGHFGSAVIEWFALIVQHMTVDHFLMIHGILPLLQQFRQAGHKVAIVFTGCTSACCLQVLVLVVKRLFSSSTCFGCKAVCRIFLLYFFAVVSLILSGGCHMLWPIWASAQSVNHVTATVAALQSGRLHSWHCVHELRHRIFSSESSPAVLRRVETETVGRPPCATRDVNPVTL